MSDFCCREGRPTALWTIYYLLYGERLGMVFSIFTEVSEGIKRTPFVVRRGLTRGTGMAKKDRAGRGAALVDPFRGQKNSRKWGEQVRRLAKPETIAANPDEHWLWSTYPQKLWITLFMKLA